MKRKENVSWWMGTGQRTWFPHLEAWLASPLTEQEQRLVTIRALVHREHAGPQSASRQWRGRPLKEREARARSCVATAVVGYPPPRSVRHAWRTTAPLRTRCGGAHRRAVPSASTCSRAVAEWATRGLATGVPDALVQEPLSTARLGPGSRDAPAIQGREKPVKQGKPPKAPRQKGRPATGGQQAPTPPKRLEVPRRQAAQAASALLPPAGDRGVKHTATGDTATWHGLQRHVDVHESGLPLSALVTAAAVPESQAAIPLRQWTSGQGTSCSDLLDAAEDARQSGEPSRARGHGPSMDRNPRGGPVGPRAPQEAQRSNERTASERFNRRLKEAGGGRNVRVQGAGQGRRHWMGGGVARVADQVLNVTGGCRSQTTLLTRRAWCASNPATQRPLGCPEARQAHKQLLMSSTQPPTQLLRTFAKGSDVRSIGKTRNHLIPMHSSSFALIRCMLLV